MVKLLENFFDKSIVRIVCHLKTVQVQFELEYIILINFLARIFCLFLTGLS